MTKNSLGRQPLIIENPALIDSEVISVIGSDIFASSSDIRQLTNMYCKVS